MIWKDGAGWHRSSETLGDLVLRLSEANNYPTPRMDIDALPCFKDLVRQKWSRSSSGSFSLHTLRLT